MLTNCTFDGIVYDVSRVMEECLAIKPDLVFLWDEAWFAFARFHQVYRARTAMEAARTLADKLRSREYRAQYEASLPRDDSTEALLSRPPQPRPGASPSQGVLDSVDPQDADRAPPGLDDPRLRSRLCAEGTGGLPRGLHGAYVDIAQLPDPRLP